MSGMTTADTQAKMVADFARTLQVEHSKLVVLKVLPFEDDWSLCLLRCVQMFY